MVEIMSLCRRLGLASALFAALLMSGAGDSRAEGCTTIGGSIFCGADGAHKAVGRRVIFNQGPSGRLTGTILTRERYRGLYATQVLPQPRPPAAGPSVRRPGSFIDFNRGRDFGAFVFPLENKLRGTIAGARPGRVGPSLPPLKR